MDEITILLSIHKSSFMLVLELEICDTAPIQKKLYAKTNHDS
jgi:hypothetical protein